MPASNSFYQLSYRLGTLLLLSFKLQYLWLRTLLKGGIVFGFFPATAAIIQFYLNYHIHKKLPHKLSSWYKKTAQHLFIKTNRIGFLYSGLLLFLWIDLQIATHFLPHSLFHICLLLFTGMFFLAGPYLLPLFLRYQMTFNQYVGRALLLVLFQPFQSLAMIISSILVCALIFWCPLLYGSAIPLILYPMSFFAFQAMQRGEQLASRRMRDA